MPKVFVGNLSYDTASSSVETLFAEAGQVVEVFMPNDRATGRPRGFAFVEYPTAEEAEAAIAKFDGHELDGRTLRVNAADDRPRRAPFRPSGGPPPFEGGYGGGGGGDRPRREKGSRRRIRGRKRSL
jgi:cold-inducible RNA-binding protein